MCADGAGVVEDEGADFASIDMRGKLRLKSRHEFSECTGRRHTQSVCQTRGESILTPWQSWVKYLKS